MQLPMCECTEVQCTVQRVQPYQGHHCGRRRNDRYDSTGLLTVTYIQVQYRVIGVHPTGLTVTRSVERCPQGCI
jgi:hypothetical protein